LSRTSTRAPDAHGSAETGGTITTVGKVRSGYRLTQGFPGVVWGLEDRPNPVPTARTRDKDSQMTTTVSSAPRSIAVIDDEPEIRSSLTRLLESAGHSVQAFPDAESFLESETTAEIGCILLDVTLPGLSGLQLLDRLGCADAAPVVMISGQADVPVAVQAMKSGASEFLTKPLASDDVLSAVDRGLAERERQLVMGEQEQSARDRVASLTRRETEVLHLIVSGYLNKQMAVELGISQKTVEFHRARVMRKLDVSCMAELMRVAFLGGVRDLYEPAAEARQSDATLVGA
jgi:two-component system CheB/CheR fusion protein